MSGIWPAPLPAVSRARIYDYLAGGKDNFLADRRVAEQMLAAHPEHAALVEANSLAVAQAAEDMARSGITQYLVLGCGLPRLEEEGVHEIVQSVHPTATVVYVDCDLQAVVTTRAYYCGNPLVTVLDATFADPDSLLADPALANAVDMDRPVGVVCALVLQHLSDANVAALSKALTTALPEGSRMVVTHPSGQGAEFAADVFTTGVFDAQEQDWALARAPEHLDRLLHGWRLADVEVAGHGLLTATGHLAN